MYYHAVKSIYMHLQYIINPLPTSPWPHSLMGLRCSRTPCSHVGWTMLRWWWVGTCTPGGQPRMESGSTLMRMPVCIMLALCLFVYLVCLFVCLFVCVVWLFVYLFVCVVWLFVCLFVYLFFCLFGCLCVHVCLFRLGHGDIEQQPQATPLRVETLSMLKWKHSPSFCSSALAPPPPPPPLLLLLLPSSMTVLTVSCGAEHTVAVCQEGVCC